MKIQFETNLLGLIFWKRFAKWRGETWKNLVATKDPKQKEVVKKENNCLLESFANFTEKTIQYSTDSVDKSNLMGDPNDCKWINQCGREIEKLHVWPAKSNKLGWVYKQLTEIKYDQSLNQINRWKDENRNQVHEMNWRSKVKWVVIKLTVGFLFDGMRESAGWDDGVVHGAGGMRRVVFGQRLVRAGRGGVVGAHGGRGMVRWVAHRCFLIGRLVDVGGGALHAHWLAHWASHFDCWHMLHGGVVAGMIWIMNADRFQVPLIQLDIKTNSFNNKSTFPAPPSISTPFHLRFQSHTHSFLTWLDFKKPFQYSCFGNQELHLAYFRRIY